MFCFGWKAGDILALSPVAKTQQVGFFFFFNMHEAKEESVKHLGPARHSALIEFKQFHAFFIVSLRMFAF